MPRSFRATNLAIEFAKRDYEVWVITNKIDDNNRKEFCKKNNINLIETLNTKKVSQSNKKISIDNKKSINLKSKIKAFISHRILWPSYTTQKINFHLLQTYKQYSLPKSFDKTISVGLPISVHSTTIFIERFLRINLGTKIADYGDPHTFNLEMPDNLKDFKKEKKLIRHFDFISIPDKIYEKSFDKFDAINKIRIIPQGFDYSIQKLLKWTGNKENTMSFSYGGRFYEKVRNPENFFNSLVLLKNENINFCFTVYTNLNEEYVQYLIKRYKDLNCNVKWCSMLKREEFLKRISRDDFVVNIHNNSKVQVPSKRIDFGLLQIPVLDTYPSESPMDLLQKIKLGKHEKYNLDQRFNIEKVVDQFEVL